MDFCSISPNHLIHIDAAKIYSHDNGSHSILNDDMDKFICNYYNIGFFLGWGNCLRSITCPNVEHMEFGS